MTTQDRRGFLETAAAGLFAAAAAVPAVSDAERRQRTAQAEGA